MIVPSDRLLFFFGAVILPFAALAGLMPAHAVIALAAVGAFLLIALLDAVAAPTGLKPVKVSLPQVIRLSAGRAGRTEVLFENAREDRRNVRLGLCLPHPLTSENPDSWITLPENVSKSRLNVPLTGTRQGRYEMEKVRLEAASPLGLWAWRENRTVNAEIRVYPDLMAERTGLASLFLRTGSGIHARREIGKGRDFEQLRAYIPGDSFADVHWKATAKRGKPVTKVFQMERTQRVYVIIDASRMSVRPAAALSGGPELPGMDRATTVCERFVAAALVTGLAAERQGDLFGVVAFDDRVRKFIRAKNGRAHYNACRDLLYTLSPRPVSPDFSELFTFLGAQVRRRSLLLFLTALDDRALADDFIEKIPLAARRHLVVVNTIRPALARPVFSAPDAAVPGDIQRYLAGHLMWNGLQKARKQLGRHGAGFFILDQARMCTELVNQYLSVKRRQVL